MKFRNQFLKYHTPMNGDGGEGGSTEKPAPTDGGNTTEGGEKATEVENNEDPINEREAELLREVMKKKGRITELSSLLADKEETLKKFDGIDVERYKALVEAENARSREKGEEENRRLREEGKFEELLAKKEQELQGTLEQVRSQHSQEVEAKTSQLAVLEGQIATMKSTIEELSLGNAFANSSFIREKLVSAFTPERTRKLYGDNFDVEDGKVVAYDKPRYDSSRVKLVDKNGHPVNFEEAISRLISADSDSDAMLKSSAKTGAGSMTHNAPQGGDIEIGAGINRIKAGLNQHRR